MSIPKYRKLVDRAIEAALAAVEIYNKPLIQYREQTFSILMLNAWELLLKARIIQEHNGNFRKIQVYENKKKKDGSRSTVKTIKKNRSGNPMTIDIKRAIALVREFPQNGIDKVCEKNLELLQEIRDNSIHFYTEHAELEVRVHEVGAASIHNFSVAVENWFGIDLKRHNMYLMPLAFNYTSDIVEHLAGGNTPQKVRKLLKMISNVEQANPTESTQLFGLTMRVNLKFVRTGNTNDIPVQITNNNPNAVPIKISEDDMLDKFPWSYTELNKNLKNRYLDIKINSNYHKIRKEIESTKSFNITRYLDPTKCNGGQRKKFYSPGILSEFDKYYSKKK